MGLSALGKENAIGKTKKPSNDIPMLRRAAERGDPKARVALATRLGLSGDQKATAEWARKAAEQKYAEGQLLLRLMYAAGNGVPLDAGGRDKVVSAGRVSGKYLRADGLGPAVRVRQRRGQDKEKAAELVEQAADAANRTSWIVSP